MTPARTSFFVLFFYWLGLAGACAQPANSLPRSTPEAEGVSSEAIARFLDSVATSGLELHSYMIVRHGRVIAEGWWKPYRADLKHTMYSVSKSFTSTAVGFAVEEGKLKLTDKVISFFPDELPAQVSGNMAKMTIKDLLTMSGGHDKEGALANAGKDWTRFFLSLPVEHTPGTHFLYNTPGSYMLAVIVQKVTGATVLDYLQPRLFEPLGITGIDWEKSPQGFQTGGWGLRLKTEDMAKFGQLYLQKGRWNGKQVVPLSWVEAATRAQIIQHPDMPKEKQANSDWEQGYGFQFWRCRHNAFRADGRAGQFNIMMPEQDAVVVLTAEVNNMQSEINLVWDNLLPALQSGPMPADETALGLLRKKSAALALPMPEGRSNVQSYDVETNALQIRNLEFLMEGSFCNLTIRTDANTYHSVFGRGIWVNSETMNPGPYPGVDMPLLLPFKVAGSYSWTDDHTLQLVARYIETPHTETMICRFEGDKLSVEITESSRADQKTILSGTRSN